MTSNGRRYLYFVLYLLTLIWFKCNLVTAIIAFTLEPSSHKFCLYDFLCVAEQFEIRKNQAKLAISELRRKLVTNNDALCILGPFCGTLRQLSSVYRSYHGEV